MSQFTYNAFIQTNVAPPGAAVLGVFNNSGNIVGAVSMGNFQRNKPTPIYKFGLFSDIHVDTSDYNYQQYLEAYPYSDEGAGDFRRGLTWLKNVEHPDFFCAAGDMSQNGTTAEFKMPQAVISACLPESEGIPFYTCTGNHDVKTAGGNGFRNYFLRNLEKTWSGMSNFEQSTSYAESFCFDKACGSKTDHFIFFSMYSYSLGPSASPYNNNDIQWLKGKLDTWKDDRVFVFTHLFFPELAGNLGRVNGTGGIYPPQNWLGGTQLEKLMKLLARYKNAIWFSGHSHWKWDLQRFQENSTVERYSKNGAWTVHVPSLALPIDSDYSVLSASTDGSREEKPLESQGGVVYVYEDSIVIRGIDFNINASQHDDPTQGYEGTEYVRYLPIANYDLDTPLTEVNKNYLQQADFETNPGKAKTSNARTMIEDLPNGYVAISISAKSEGYYVIPDNFTIGSTPTLVLEDLKVYRGLHTTSGTEISLPSYVGFYNESTNPQYQIVNGFTPQQYGTGGENKFQFNSSSKYTGGNITIVMKAKII